MKVRCESCFKEYENQGLCPYCGHVFGQPNDEVFELSIGTILQERYIIGGVLGLGGFGITYKAWDKKLNIAVAIKEFYPSGCVNRTLDSPEVMIIGGRREKEFRYGLDRFLEEAKNTCKFNMHPNIVNVFEYFEENNTAYIVMEFLEGMTLAGYMHKHHDQLDIDECIHIVDCVCEALKEIHKTGIIHRDISPDNIYMCDNGDVKVIDFGAARFSKADVEKKYSIILKPGFAPPEQYEQISKQGPWTDIYALGATMYYMVTGVKPEESTSRRTKDELKDPIEVKNNIPEHLSLGIMKAMALDSYMRFDSVIDFQKVIHKEKKIVSLKKEHANKRNKRLFTLSICAVLIAICVSLFFSQVEDEKLKPATLNIWYVQDDGETSGQSYENIIKDFNKAYPNIKIKSYGIAKKEYAKKLEEAYKNKKMPTIFESEYASEDMVKDSIDLSGVIYPNQDQWHYPITSLINKQAIKNCSILNDYDEYFKQYNQIPMSYNVPVIYNNTAVLRFNITEIEHFNDLYTEEMKNKKQKILVNSEMKNKLAGLFEDNKVDEKIVEFGDISDFQLGNHAIYISDTSEFYDVRNLGTYQILSINNKQLPCEFHNLWSVKTNNTAEKKAAKRFMSYMLTYKSQDYLYGNKDKIEAIPINDKALENFCSTFKNIQPIFQNIKNFSFVYR